MSFKPHLLSVLLLCLLSITACKKGGDDPTPIGSGETFAEVIENGGTINTVPVESTDTTAVNPIRETLPDNTIRKCSTTTVSLQSGAGGNSGFPLFNPGAEVIYPGSLLQGKSLGKATPDIIPLKRAGGTVYIDIINGSSNVAVTVEEVKRSTIATAMNQIIESNSGVVPSNFSFKYEDIYTRQQLAVKMKMNYESWTTNVEGKLSFSTDKEYNRILVNMTQMFYTMGFDYPLSHDDLFAPEVTPEQLGKYVYAGNPAAYISSVSYGRIYYMLIESTSSLTKMKASISASFNAAAASGGIDADAAGLSSMDNLVIKVFALGGESQSTTLTIGETNLNTLVSLLAKAADIRTGVPLSYITRLAADPSQVVSTQLATQYSVTNCDLTTYDPAPSAFDHWSVEVLDKIGPIGAVENIAQYPGQHKFLLINKEGTKYLISEGSQLNGPYPIDSLNEANASFPLNNIGAFGIRRNPYESRKSDLFFAAAGVGNNIHYSQAEVGNSYYAYGDDFPQNNPFAIEGIGAITWFNTNTTFISVAGRMIFNRDGNKYFYWSYHSKASGGSWTSGLNSVGSVQSTSNLGNIPFSKVGAAAFFEISGNDYHLFFDTEGESYTVRTISNNAYSGHHTL